MFVLIDWCNDISDVREFKKEMMRANLFTSQYFSLPEKAYNNITYIISDRFICGYCSTKELAQKTTDWVKRAKEEGAKVYFAKVDDGAEYRWYKPSKEEWFNIYKFSHRLYS